MLLAAHMTAQKAKTIFIFIGRQPAMTQLLLLLLLNRILMSSACAQLRRH